MSRSTHDEGDKDSALLEDFWWVLLVNRLLHPTQVQIIEALRWTDEPLSATELVLVFDGESSRFALVHHLRGLLRLDAIAVAATPAQQAATEVPYRLARGLRDER
jgi:hypothetical protein